LIPPAKNSEYAPQVPTDELSLAAFSDVQLADKSKIREFLWVREIILSDYNFSTLYCWGGVYRFRWMFFRGRLLIHNGRDDFLLMPAGEYFSVEEMVAISDAMRREGKSGNFVLVDADYVRLHPQIGTRFRVELDEADADYLYLSRKLVELKGKKLIKKRNLISQFRTLHPDSLCRNLGPADAAECRGLAVEWSRHRDSSAADELLALDRALASFEELDLSGVGIFIGGRMAAFSIYSRQNSNTVSVHFEKFDPAVKGASQVVNWETARVLTDRFPYINREQDLGIEGLRMAKMSYSPEHRVMSYMLLR
jgi:hypothetical protein